MAWTATGGGDHDGDDWIFVGGSFGGVHTGIGIFRLTPGAASMLSNTTINCIEADIQNNISGNYAFTINAARKIYVNPAAIISTAGAYPGSGIVADGAAGSTGIQGSTGTPGSACGECCHGNAGSVGGTGNLAGDGNNGGNGGNGSGGGVGKAITLNAVKVTYGQLYTNGGQGGNGGRAWGGTGGTGGQGGTGGAGGDPSDLGCPGTPLDGGAGGGGGGGGQGGDGGNGGVGGTGGVGGSGGNITLRHARPKSTWLSGASLIYSGGPMGVGGTTIGGPVGSGGPGGNGGFGAAGINGGGSGATGASGSTGPVGLYAGSAGSNGSNGSSGSAGTLTDGDTGTPDVPLQGRSIYQEGGAYLQRMRVALL